MSGYIAHFQQMRPNCFQINSLSSDFLYSMLIAAIAEQRERLRANEGQIYVHHSRDLSCFPYVDGCAATGKLSRNVGLNRSMITSSSLWKLDLCTVHTLLTSLLSLTCNRAPVYSIWRRFMLHSQYVYCHAICSTNYVLYMDLNFQIVTLLSIKW